MKLYCVRDVLAGYYPPVALSNDRVAIRFFCSGNLSDGNIPVTDLELYRVGEFNHENGFIESETPVFLYAGRDIKEKKDEPVSDEVR